MRYTLAPRVQRAGALMGRHGYGAMAVLALGTTVDGLCVAPPLPLLSSLRPLA